ATMPVEAYDRLDLRATLKLENWKVSAFVRNVLDSFDYTNISYNGFVDPTPADFLVLPLEPRTFGVVVTRSFSRARHGPPPTAAAAMAVHPTAARVGAHLHRRLGVMRTPEACVLRSS